MRKMKYAALNMMVLLLGILALGVAGSAIEGLLPWQVCAGMEALLILSIRAAWREIGHMERAARHAQRLHAARRALAATCTAAPAQASARRAVPDLRVA